MDELEKQEEIVNGEQEKEQPKEFTLVYRISEEELYRFHTWISRDQLEKGRKRGKIMALIELVFGAAYLVSILVTGQSSTLINFLLAALLMGMGVFGLMFQKYGFEKQLHKAVSREHQKNPYFQNDIVVDFYPDKCVERMGEKSQNTFWKDIQAVFSGDWAQIISMEGKRCLLIPTGGLGEEKTEMLKAYFHRICQEFEKSEETI